MNFKTTIVLIVILAAVGIWVLVDRHGGDQGTTQTATEQNAAAGKPLFTVLAEDVNRVTLRPAEGKTLDFHKEGASWRIESPVKAPAETWEVDGLVRDLLALRSRGQVAADPSTGLDHPGYQITLETKSGPILRLAVGDKTAIGDAMYVRLEGQKQAEVVQADVYATLIKPVDQFRDKHLVEASATNIKQLTVDRPGKEKLVLEKEGAHWRMTGPGAMPADDAAVSDLLFAITGAQAIEYVPADQATAPMTRLDHPQASIWFSTVPPSTQPATRAAGTQPSGTTLLLGGYDTILKENVYATVAGSGVVVKLPASTLGTFDKTPLQLRDKTVMDIEPAKVRGLTLNEKRGATTRPTSQPALDQTMRVERRSHELTLGPAAPAAHASSATTAPAATAPATSAATSAATTTATTAPATAAASQSDWIVSGTQTAADDNAVEQLLGALHPLRAESYLESRPAAAPVATYTLTIRTDGKKPVELIVQDQGTSQPLLGLHDGVIFELDRAMLTTLDDALGHYAGEK